MQLIRAKVTSKGQITLPKHLRESLSVHEGDHLEFTVHPNGEAEVRKLKETHSSAGILKHLAMKTAVTVEEMNEAIAESASQHFNKSVQ